MKETKEEKIKKLEKKLKQVRVQIVEIKQNLEDAQIRQAGLVREMMMLTNGGKE